MKAYTCYQSYCWYAFIRQDLLQYYRYTQKWVELFEKEPFMMEVETAHYIKGNAQPAECAFRPAELPEVQ